jgi:hypothetical protein
MRSLEAHHLPDPSLLHSEACCPARRAVFGCTAASSPCIRAVGLLQVLPLQVPLLLLLWPAAATAAAVHAAACPSAPSVLCHAPSSLLRRLHFTATGPSWGQHCRLCAASTATLQHAVATGKKTLIPRQIYRTQCFWHEILHQYISANTCNRKFAYTSVFLRHAPRAWAHNADRNGGDAFNPSLRVRVMLVRTQTILSMQIIQCIQCATPPELNVEHALHRRQTVRRVQTRPRPKREVDVPLNSTQHP